MLRQIGESVMALCFVINKSIYSKVFQKETGYENQNLQMNFLNFPYFSRLFKPHTVNCYVFSLVFALMGSLQGKVFSECIQSLPATLSKSRAEVRFASLVAWAYTFMVVLTSECPKSSCTSFGAAPFDSRLLV